MRKSLFLLLFLPLLSAAGPARAAAAKHPAPNGLFKVQGACPFECCAFGKWHLYEDRTPVFQSPSISSKVIHTLRKGEKFTSLTGVNYVIPGEALVVHYFQTIDNGPVLNPGDKVIVLDYLAEGYTRAWAKGKFFEEQLFMGDDYYCDKPSEACWLREEKKTRSFWWVKVKLGNGKTGWIIDPGSIEGAYGC